MKLELDHLFILTASPKEAGDCLVDLGLKESFSRDHKGQGTSNRRFEFANGMLELLYIRDEHESRTGPASRLHLADRVTTADASPFGLILTKLNHTENSLPFDGWAYQPDYFPAPNAFHVGDNAELFDEPLCIYVPFMGPVTRGIKIGGFSRLTHVEIGVPGHKWSDALKITGRADRVTVSNNDVQLATITLDDGKHGLCKDLRPQLPVIVKW